MNLILEIAPFSVILPLIPAITRYRQYTNELRLISIYIFIGAVTELISSLLSGYRINNLPLLHLYVPATFTVLLLFFKIILRGLLKKWMWYGIIAVFYTFTIIDSFWLQGLYAFNSYAINLTAVFIILFAILCFYNISTEFKVKQIERYPVFWINTGLLFYYSGSLLTFTLSNEAVFFSKIIRIYLWSIHALFVILMYLLISIGLWVYRRNKISTTSSS